jgi:antitoxin (DNA-binding transcriptional repressor) of toxin-antitoxin stability system
MTTIPTTDLAKELPTILRAIASGEEFLVTEAGRPVARIIAPAQSEPGQVLSGDDWQRELDEWCRDAQSRANRYPPGFVLDDSRETIYGERENAQL